MTALKPKRIETQAPSRNKPVANGEIFKVFAAITMLPNLNGTDKAVLGVLVDHADAKGKAWPKEATIAEELALSERTVRRAISRLIRSPYVKRWRRSCTSNVYVIAFDAIIAVWHAYKARRAKHDRPKLAVDNDRPELAAHDRPKVAANKKQETRNNKKEKEQERVRASRASPARPVPDDWKPAEATIERLLAQGFTEDQIETEREAFIDWNQANGKRYSDHEAAFRNWMRKARKFEERGRRPGESWVDEHGIPHTVDQFGTEYECVNPYRNRNAVDQFGIPYEDVN